ncbi:MAG: phosphodiesterase [Clostridiales bacterium]|nr:phosphodiesterase [Candidatus Scatonaster coprocaballi]
MKYFVASDIHGYPQYCEQLLEAYDREQADRLILLGDLLYFGPRNTLYPTYDPKAVIALLNARKDEILCVRGNCDAEVDQMVLDFPIMAEYTTISLGKRLVFCTHGHHFNPSNLPSLRQGDILLTGHTHVAACEELPEGILYLNPGSPAYPKENTHRGYIILSETEVQLKELDGKIVHTYDLTI